MPNIFTLPFKNQLSEITRLHEVVASYCDQHQVSQDIQQIINLALEELIVNTISYGFTDQNEHDIVVSFNIIHNELIAIIEDDGIAFNPLTSNSPDFEANLADMRIGGLGIHLVKTMVDKIEYERINSKNRLSLHKKLS